MAKFTCLIAGSTTSPLLTPLHAQASQTYIKSNSNKSEMCQIHSSCVNWLLPAEPKASESPQCPCACAPVWWKQATSSQTNLHMTKVSKASTKLQTCHTGFTDYKEWVSAHRLKHKNVGAHRTTKRHINAL